MSGPDNELITQFQEKFGGILLPGNGRGIGGSTGYMLQPQLPLIHNEGIHLDDTQLDNSGVTLGLASGSPFLYRCNALG
jgi:hypothetical protein